MWPILMLSKISSGNEIWAGKEFLLQSEMHLFKPGKSSITFPIGNQVEKVGLVHPETRVGFISYTIHVSNA